MPSFDYDLNFLSAASEVLKDYLLSKEIYWSSGLHTGRGQPDYPQLTLGWVLLYARRAQGWVEKPSQEAQLRQVLEPIERVKSQWSVAWEQKAKAEFHARLILWRNFLEDYRQQPENHYDRYAYEVQRRAMLHLLKKESGDIPPEEGEMLGGLDAILRAILEKDEFIWDATYASAFPEGEFWYLYGRLPKSPKVN